MQKWAVVVVLVLLVLAGAMGLRNLTSVRSAGPVVLANGTGPIPPDPWLNGTGPIPPDPWLNGAGQSPWSR
jgi:hypothetical protein